MAIDLPPSEPAQIITSAPTADYGQALALSDGDRFFQVYGNSLLSQDAVIAALDDVNSTEDALAALSEAYRDRGYFLVRVQALETRRGTNLYVTERRFTDVDVPDPLEPYFERFLNKPDVTDNGFRRMALLAQTHARQAGYEPYALYPVDEKDPTAMTFDVKVDGAQRKRYTLDLGVSNFGNRFIGEYFAMVDASYADVDGNRYRASIDGAFEGEGPSEDDGDLIKAGLGYDRIGVLGQFSLDASYTDYDYVVSTDREFGPVIPDLGISQRSYAGETLEVSAEASHLLFAGERTRLIIAESVSYVDDEVTDETADALVLDERYTLAGLRGTLGHEFALFGLPHSVGLTVEGQHAISADTAETGAGRADADDDFTVSTVQGSFAVDVLEHTSVSLLAEHQWAFDPLPQNEEWVLGGPTRIAAYLPGALEGDEGSYGRLEVTQSAIPAGIATFEVAVFYEIGTAEYEERFDTERQTIADAGVQLTTALLDDRLALTVISAHPTQRDNVDRDALDRIEQDVFVQAQWSF
ncbi:ShlB/FhaC/HecB family hemolysin secretion/activation protein [uncultured Abyssibacter sp.]|uniref:ShlB/FhaC/HecB family hemolysin secretion/activation protein n=1 Tax=uncultured Abyssibacter sp. TaxID=2320202 RepID=UPI0032B1DDF1